MNPSVPFPDDLRRFVETVKWTYAKTMPKWPHEYIVRERVDEEMFLRLFRHIREHGYEGKFYKKTIVYFDHDGRTYWTNGFPIEETTIINRCLKEDTYESRLLKGTLPSD